MVNKLFMDVLKKLEIHLFYISDINQDYMLSGA